MTIDVTGTPPTTTTHDDHHHDDAARPPGELDYRVIAERPVSGSRACAASGGSGASGRAAIGCACDRIDCSMMPSAASASAGIRSVSRGRTVGRGARHRPEPDQLVLGLRGQRCAPCWAICRSVQAGAIVRPASTRASVATAHMARTRSALIGDGEAAPPSPNLDGDDRAGDDEHGHEHDGEAECRADDPSGHRRPPTRVARFDVGRRRDVVVARCSPSGAIGGCWAAGLCACGGAGGSWVLDRFLRAARDRRRPILVRAPRLPARSGPGRIAARCGRRARRAEPTKPVATRAFTPSDRASNTNAVANCSALPRRVSVRKRWISASCMPPPGAPGSSEKSSRSRRLDRFEPFDARFPCRRGCSPAR